MNEITCLRCKSPLDASVEACPNCGERVTSFQRTYATKLIDGKYQILERLGLGGMGEIFKVRHIHLNEERVIKIMRANIASDQQSLQRFLQEARTSTMIKHRNLAMLYDFSTLEDGSYYMVWEYIDGTNIQKWVAQNGPMPPRLAIEVAIQALAGLEHLHSMGLIHRDISPENIMLTHDHKGRLVTKVIDFGIAKQLSEGDAGHGLTQTGMFVGKLKYASPEQAGFMKEGETIDARSDLYSFGVVLYEMVAGRAPFLATNPQGYILKHVTERPLAISQVNPNVTVPPDLEHIIFRALEKDRNARYESAAAMEADLEAIRNQIEPDKTYGLGDRLVTFGGRTTIGGGTRTGHGTAPVTTPGSFTGGTQAATAPGRAGGTQPVAAQPAASTPAMRVPGPDEATVVTAPTGTQPRPAPGFGDQPTVVDRIPSQTGQTMQRAMGGEAASTIADSQPWPANRPTVAVERPAAGATAPETPKSKLPMIIGIAAVVVILVAIAAFVALRKPKPADVVNTTTTPTQTTVTTTAAAVNPNDGILLLTSPFGETAKIIDLNTNKEVVLADNVVPLRKSLPPGNYRITLSSANGQETREVKLAAGEIREIKPSGNRVDVDRAAEDILRQ